MNSFEQFKAKCKEHFNIDLTEEDQQITEDHHLTVNEVADVILDNHDLPRRGNRVVMRELVAELDEAD